MKKIFVLGLTVLLCLAWCLTAFAGGFVSSPSSKGAPELVEAKNESEDCEAVLQIKGYGERHSLPDAIREVFEYAYSVIKNTTDLTTLSAKLAQIAQEKGYDASYLAVSDFFDISSSDCDTHENHGHFELVLKADALKNFVCLLHYYNGEWRVVEDAKVVENGTHLEFTEDEFSPFAIVVYTGEAPVQAPSGLTVGQGILLAVGIIIGLGGLFSLAWFVIIPAMKQRKKKEEQ